MTTIRKKHQEPYRELPDLKNRLSALKKVVVSLRDCDLPTDIKKRMLNHAVWEITKAQGDFVPEFRSKGVREGKLGDKIERDHVFKRKNVVADILSKSKSLDSVMKRIVHCVVTTKEHKDLKDVKEMVDGWKRYRKAKIAVYCYRNEKPKRHV